MPDIDTYRKHAKLLVRWHREGNFSVGGKVRQLERYRHLTDREALAMTLPLALAQEIVAVEAGYPDWAALKRAKADAEPLPRAETGTPRLLSAAPVLFVRDVAAAAAHYAATLGFAVDFLHGSPSFYGSVSRDGHALHLRHVDRPNFGELAAREGSLILALIEVSDLKALYRELQARGADIVQAPVKQAWGGTDLHVRDPDGNVIAFMQRPDTKGPRRTRRDRARGAAGIPIPSTD